MISWLRRLTGGGGADGGPPVPAGAGRDLDLDLAGREAEIARLKAEVSRLRSGGSAAARSAAGAALEELFTAAGAPAAQLLTQAHLTLDEGREVAARDLALVARRLVGCLEDAGLQREESLGAEVAFDPGRHAVLGGEEAVAGAAVTVRFHGFSTGGKVLVKAGVQPAEEA